MQEQLISPWVFTIEGVPRELAIKIRGISPKPEGGFILDSLYGQVGGSQGPFKADLIVLEDQKLTIVFTTQANSRLEVAQVDEKTFQGTLPERSRS